MKKILTFGVFDMMHVGHVKLFQKAKESMGGVYLIVAVQDSNSVLKYKPDTVLVNSLEERFFMVQSVKYVDEVVVYNDVYVDIKNIDFDILAKGPDQNHEGFKAAEEWCLENNKEILVISRTEGISSEMIRYVKKYK